LVEDAKAFEANLPGSLDVNWLKQSVPAAWPNTGLTTTNYQLARNGAMVDDQRLQINYGNTTGPDGTDYVYVPPNIVAGTQGYWAKSTSNSNANFNKKQYVPVNNPTAAPVDYTKQLQPYLSQTSQVNTQYSTQVYQQSQAQQQAQWKAASIARQNASQDQFLNNVTNFIEKTIGAQTLLTVKQVR
jgi:hypothetical protein